MICLNLKKAIAQKLTLLLRIAQAPLVIGLLISPLIPMLAIWLAMYRQTTPDSDDPVSYSISGGPDDIPLFQINSAGEITLIAQANASGTYQFNVIAMAKAAAQWL